MLSPVSTSVTRLDHTKTDKVRIMKFSPYGSPIHLVLRNKFHPEILKIPHERRRQTREGWVKSAVFLSLSVNISKTVADAAKVKLMTNGN